MGYIRTASTAIVSSAIIFIFAGIGDSQERNLQSAKIWFDKGMLFREAGDPVSNEAFKQAAGDLDSFIEAQGKDIQGLTRAYTLRARCHNLLGNNEQAIRDLDRAIELSPDDGDIYYLRSFIHEITGHAQLSIADLKTSARKGNEKARGELKAKGIQWQ
jgi:tetratricopeptide (TPR) repeat protein